MRYLLLLALLVCVACVPQQADGPVPFDPAAIDPADWSAVLERFVDDEGNVDYHALADDRAQFDRYLAGIRGLSPDSHPEAFPDDADRLAYWINAYNAHIFDGVLERGPEEESVWRGLVSGLEFFVRRRIEVGGREISLKGLEDTIIRGRFGDPRIHAALNCASIGCPRLRREAFVGERLDAQLDEMMREFVETERHVSVDDERRTIYLSKIFQWYESDFVDHIGKIDGPESTLVDALNLWREARLPRDYAVEFLDYDKRINAQ